MGSKKFGVREFWKAWVKWMGKPRICRKIDRAVSFTKSTIGIGVPILNVLEMISLA